MSQSAVIAAALIAGFALYLAANNRLSAYAAVLWGATSQPVASPAASSGSGNIFAAIGSLLTGGPANPATTGTAANAATGAAEGIMGGLNALDALAGIAG